MRRMEMKGNVICGMLLFHFRNSSSDNKKKGKKTSKD